MWNDWFFPSLVPLLWVVLSTFGMYVAVIALARWSGVRSFAQMSTFDIAVTIAIGSLVATTAATQDPPLSQGIAAVATLYGFQLLVSRLRKRFPWMRNTTDNTPIVLMGPGGTMKHANLAVARVTENDLRTQLRKANVADLKTVQAVVMEGTGTITVLHSRDGKLAEDAWILKDVRDYSTPAVSAPHRSTS